jgi:hypothetical protein
VPEVIGDPVPARNTGLLDRRRLTAAPIQRRQNSVAI